jgi:hypothetical protein
MGLAILAVAAHDPHLLEPLRLAHAGHLKELQDSDMKFERAAIISLAADGLMLQELLGVASYTPAQKHKVREEMLRMIDEGVAG